MSITIDSTGLDDQERERREGGVLWARTKALLNRLDELEAAQAERDDPAKVEAMKARALHAGATKAERLHAALDAAVKRHWPQLTLALWKTRRSRADWLVKQMKDPPHWRTIDAYLNTLHI